MMRAGSVINLFSKCVRDLTGCYFLVIVLLWRLTLINTDDIDVYDRTYVETGEPLVLPCTIITSAPEPYDISLLDLDYVASSNETSGQSSSQSKEEENECAGIHSVAWYHNDKRIFIATPDGSISVSAPHIEHRTTFRPGAPPSLYIEGIQQFDNGQYRCEVTYFELKRNCPAVQYTDVIVLIPPEVPYITVIDGTNVSQTKLGPYDEGDELTLVCTAENGNPPAEISWWIDLEEVVGDRDLPQGRSTLRLHMDREHVQVRLECKAKNQALSAPLITWVDLDVRAQPVSLVITGPTENSREGEDVTVSCKALGSRPAANITWHIGDDDLDETTATINNTVLPTHDGTWDTHSQVTFTAEKHHNTEKIECRAVNAPNSEPLRRTVQLSVQYVPAVRVEPDGVKDIQEGDDVTIKCFYDANPTDVISVRWLLNDKPINSEYEREESEESATTSSSDSSQSDNHSSQSKSRKKSKKKHDTSESENETKEKGNDATEEDEIPSKYIVKEELVELLTLNLEDVQRHQQGLYSCVIENDIGKSESITNLTVNVHYVPEVELVITPNAVDAESEVNVTLLCNITDANPDDLFMIKWFLNGEVIGEAKEDTVLLQNVDRGHHGEYSCQAKNSMGWGNASKTELLLVRYPPGQAYMTTDPKIVLRGSPVTLKCRVIEPGEPPITHYVWRRGSYDIDYTDGTNYTIDEVVFDDVSNYTCAGVNYISEGPPAVLELDVLAPPQIVIEPPKTIGYPENSTEISLTCRAECKPMCRVSWYKDGSKLSAPYYSVRTAIFPPDEEHSWFDTMESTLIFEMSTWARQLSAKEDDANYTCMAHSTPAGSAVSASTYFRVEYAPRVMHLSSRHLEVVEGEELPDVFCQADANPSSDYTWFYNGVAVASGPVLNFSHPMPRDNAGGYTCLAQNRLGSLTANLTVDVIYKPKCTLELERQGNGSSHFVCTADSNPSEVIFTWLFNNQSTHPGKFLSSGLTSTLRVKPKHLDDGEYSCIASNAVGTSDMCILLIRDSEESWMARLSSEKRLKMTAIIFGGIIMIIVAIAMSLIVWYRIRLSPKGRKPRHSQEKSDENGEAPTKPGFYENLPFHGMQSPPDKPFRPVLPDLIYADSSEGQGYGHQVKQLHTSTIPRETSSVAIIDSVPKRPPRIKERDGAVPAEA